MDAKLVRVAGGTHMRQVGVGKADAHTIGVIEPKDAAKTKFRAEVSLQFLADASERSRRSLGGSQFSASLVPLFPQPTPTRLPALRL
jgi:hypothetical protein